MESPQRLLNSWSTAIEPCPTIVIMCDRDKTTRLVRTRRCPRTRALLNSTLIPLYSQAVNARHHSCSSNNSIMSLRRAASEQTSPQWKVRQWLVVGVEHEAWARIQPPGELGLSLLATSGAAGCHLESHLVPHLHWNLHGGPKGTCHANRPAGSTEKRGQTIAEVKGVTHQCTLRERHRKRRDQEAKRAINT